MSEFVKHGQILYKLTEELSLSHDSDRVFDAMNQPNRCVFDIVMHKQQTDWSLIIADTSKSFNNSSGHLKFCGRL